MADSHLVCQASHYLFKDKISREFYCKNCSEVCDRLTKTSCCKGNYCHAFISIYRENGHPCPACGKENYEISEAIEQQEEVMEYAVFCSLKEKGCQWFGPLKLLKHHLSLQGDCQYGGKSFSGIQHPYYSVKQNERVRNKLSHSSSQDKVTSQLRMLSKESPSRLSSQVSEVSSKRDCSTSSEHNDWKRICTPDKPSLQLVRENKTSQNLERTSKHQRDCEEVEFHKLGDKKLWEFVEELHVQNKVLLGKLEEQRTLMLTRELEQENRLIQLEMELTQQRQAYADCLEKLQIQEEKLQELSSDLNSHRKNTNITDLRDMIVVKKYFQVEGISRMKLTTDLSAWTTAVSYTHFSGYKYYICMTSRSFSVIFHLHIVQGEFDHLLKWPLKAGFIVELHHPRGGGNLKCISGTRLWKKPSQSHSAHVLYFRPNPSDIYQAFLEISELENFIKRDKLSCSIVDFTIHNK